MKKENNRRSFLKKITIGSLGATVLPNILLANDKNQSIENPSLQPGSLYSKAKHDIKKPYKGDFLNRVAFPIGGIGAGMFCLEGTGAISNMSVRNNPDVYHEPGMFAAISLKDVKDGALVLEGPVPEWKKFGQGYSALGGNKKPAWGLPRFEEVSFDSKFPFGEVSLKDKSLPLDVKITGWSPFVPTNEDASSLPVGGLEYSFKNTGNSNQDYIFSYNSRNFMTLPDVKSFIKPIKNGFVLGTDATPEAPEKKGEFAIFTNEDNAVIDYCWFRGVSFYDALTLTWKTIKNFKTSDTKPVERDSPGASLYIPFSLKPGAKKTIRLMMAWYVPDTNLTEGTVEPSFKSKVEQNSLLKHHKPWYSSKFGNINEVADYWKNNYDDLKAKTQLFTDAFYTSTLPAEVTEAVAANLSILKSPTVLRQHDGRFWCYEGSGDSWGSCYGSCTHVWNYAQAVSHLFPRLERSLRDTEFNESQNADGHQMFRSNLPITPAKNTFYAAADGQLGGIMKVYREWRISGDNEWLKKIFPNVKASLDYCSKTWDPKGRGVIEEPHHNTYDIEFWGPTGFATGYYLGALKALVIMGAFLKKDMKKYETLYTNGKTYLENELYNGEYFIQKIEWKNLQAPDPTKAEGFAAKYKPEDLELMRKEGPKYQYGTGCLSDGVIGAWLSGMCGLDSPFEAKKIKSHLLSVYEHNYKTNLEKHANPQRPTYAIGDEGGLLLCSWPRGGALSLPFIYSNEVWTGIEYQVASHLMLMGEVDKGLDIVRTCRDRYNGTTRNPYNEYECGHWYARALASYGMLESLTGVRYDAVTKTLHIDSKIGDFTSFLSTATGFGTVTLKNGKTSLNVVYGKIEPKNINIAGKLTAFA